MSDNPSNADKRIAQALEKLKKSINYKYKIKYETKDNLTNISDINHSPVSENIEEKLIISPEKTLIKDRNFDNLDWNKKEYQELTFTNCFISNSKVNLEEADLTGTDFSPSEYDGLSLFKADMRNADISNIDVRKLDFSGVKIVEWQQVFFIENLGIIAYPDNE